MNSYYFKDTFLTSVVSVLTQISTSILIAKNIDDQNDEKVNRLESTEENEVNNDDSFSGEAHSATLSAYRKFNYWL